MTETAEQTAEKFSDIDPWEMLSKQLSQEAANYNPVGGTSERACSNCQWFIAPAGCVVVESWPDAIVGNGLSDLWRERVDRFSSPEPLEVVIVGGGSSHLGDDDNDKEGAEGNSTVKQETKTEGGVSYSASDFASVPDRESPSTWKLRLAAGSSGSFTVAQVGRAITALQPSGFRGNQVQLSSSERSSALRKISSTIGGLDATDDQKSNLRERLDDVKEVGILIRIAKGAKDKVLETLRGVRADSLTSQSAISTSPFTLTKDRNGQYRWTAIVSNNFRDRDSPPEIISEAAHKEFAASLNSSGDWPELWLHHIPIRWGQADWVAYSDGMMTYSGTVDPDMEFVAVALEETAKSTPLGVSHGFKYLHSDAGRGIIGWYRSFEISPLPLSKAANVFTGFAIAPQEGGKMAFEKDDRAKLETMLAPNVVDALESRVEGMAEGARGAGLESKEITEPDESDAVTQSIKAFVESDSFRTALGVGLKGFEETLTGVKESIDSIDTRLKAVEATEDEKVAAIIAGAGQRAVAGHIASRATDNVVEKNDPLAKLAPETDIFDEIAGSMLESAGRTR